MEIKTYSPSSHKIKAVVYGTSGSGKTYFAASAPNPIFASSEGGLLSTVATGNRIDFAEIKSLEDLQALFLKLKAGGHGYETVVIDSITEINEIIKEDLEAKRGGKMQIQDWGDLGKKIKKVLRSFRDLDMHTIFIAQEMLEKDDQKIQKIVPSLNGKAATEIAYFMDVVGYTSINKNGEHKITVSPHERLLTKDRSGKLADLESLNFSEWVNAVKAIEIKPAGDKKSGEVANTTPKREKKPETPANQPPETPPAAVVEEKEGVDDESLFQEYKQRIDVAQNDLEVEEILNEIRGNIGKEFFKLTPEEIKLIGILSKKKRETFLPTDNQTAK